MKLIKQNGKNVEAIIEEITETELKVVNKTKRFGFNWVSELKYEVYQIHLVDSTEVLGLMSLIDIPAELRIQIHLLEVSKENVGKDKKIENIPGCLIAFACRLAFTRGYGGFVSLVPKTLIIQHYQTKYGFRQMGRQLAVFEDLSYALMEQYL